MIVDDMTRSTPVSQILPLVLEDLAGAKVRSNQIVIVIALGSHRVMTNGEISERLGEQIIRNYRVLNSCFCQPNHLVNLGPTEDGRRVLIDEEVAAADFKIGIGSIVPHGATGWSGGAKIIFPGGAGEETVMQFHFLHGLREENMTGREECPVRLRLESWVEKVGLDFIINAILTPDDQVYRIVAGHYRDAHRKG